VAARECKERLNPEDQLKRCQEETKILREELVNERREHKVSKNGFNSIPLSSRLA
jgi:hypothetical protein